jgi:hypothetical protein
MHGGRLAPCLLRSHTDTEACSLVAALLLRHSGHADSTDASVMDAVPAPASAPPPVSLQAIIHTRSAVAAPAPAASSAAAVDSQEHWRPPARLPPPPPPKSAPAPAPAAALASGGELMLPLNKSRSRSGSMEGSAGYASFKKELQVICRVTRVELACRFAVLSLLPQPGNIV